VTEVLMSLSEVFDSETALARLAEVRRVAEGE